MGDWFLGEIRAFSMPWAPDGWALCDGALLNSQQNAALYALIGTTFGGNGTNFNLPDLRGRTPVGTAISDQVYQRGVKGGTETVSLLTSQIPQHNHPFNVMGTTSAFPLPAGNFISSAGTSAAAPTAPNLFAAPSASMVALNPGSISSTGAGTGHNNLQPSLVLNYCIAIRGTFPPRN